MTNATSNEHAAVVDQLRSLEGRLQEAESIIQAIKQGEVDAVLVNDQAGKTRVFTLESDDRPYRALIEQMQEGAVTLGKDGKILYCNRFLATALGVGQERVIGKNLGYFMAPSAASKLSQMLSAAMDAPVRGELDLVAANRQNIPVYLSLSSLRRSEDGPLLYGVITDLTEQKSHLRDMAAAADEARSLAAERDQKAARLRESEANFRMLAENANDLIIWVGPNGDRRYLSPAAVRIIGVTPAILIDKGLLPFTHPDDRDAMSALHDKLLCSVLTQGSLTFRAINPDRGEVWVEMSARSFVDPTTYQSFGYISVLRDVSDRVRLEAERDQRERELRATNAELDRLARHFAKARSIAEQASRAKTRFLATMSHELRTPLNGILGYAQLLRMDKGLTDIQSQRVESMLTTGTHLLEMISCVLDLSEIETVGIELQISAVNLQNLVEACVSILFPVASAKQLTLRLTIMPDVPRRIMADPSRLRQILLNLLGNAVKFTARGSVELRLQTITAGTRLRFEVVDTGPGIAISQRARLFEAFERFDTESADSVEGSGLGLSLSKQLATLMHGQLGYEEHPGGGSVFWLELPLETEMAASAVPARAADFNERKTVNLPRDGEPKRVLIVDDVAMNRDIASAFLQSAGYAVVCAGGGAEAVETASAQDFTVILMDVRMPDVDGLEATRRIRTINGPRRLVPIVALTAQVFTEQINTCREAGMDAHVAKPFTLDTLLGAIERGIETACLRAASDRIPGKAASVAPTSSALDMIGAPADAAPPILDLAVFERTAAMLAPDVVTSYLRTLAEKSEALKLSLATADDVAASADSLADSIHALAGSAGMFGFKRLVSLAKPFEHALRADPSRADNLRLGVCTVLAASIAEMHRHFETSPPETAAAIE